MQPSPRTGGPNYMNSSGSPLTPTVGGYSASTHDHTHTSNAPPYGSPGAPAPSGSPGREPHDPYEGLRAEPAESSQRRPSTIHSQSGGGVASSSAPSLDGSTSVDGFRGTSFAGSGGAGGGWPALCAPLHKLTGSGILSRWKRRLFRLSRGSLSWSKEQSEGGGGFDKTLNLMNCRLEDYPSKPFAFSIVGKDGKVLMSIACDSSNQKTAWMMQLQQTMDILSGDRQIVKTERKVSRDDFELLTMIGKGTCGRVMKVREKETGLIYAVKIMSKTHLLKNNMQRTAFVERGILLAIKHPFIVKLHHCFQTDNSLYFVMDFHCGGSLLVHLKKANRFSELAARVYIAEISLAIDHLHSRGCMHRDLKLGNILLDKQGHAILTDFGLAIYSGQADTFCGTMCYMAPEVLKHEPYTKAVDWWSFGVAIYQMLTGNLPYSGDHGDIARQIINNPIKLPAHLSKGARVLILALMEKNPKERLDFSGVHLLPFFKGIDWDVVEKRQMKVPFVPDIGGDDLKFFREGAGNQPANAHLSWEDDYAAGPHFEGFTFHGT